MSGVTKKIIRIFSRGLRGIRRWRRRRRTESMHSPVRPTPLVASVPVVTLLTVAAICVFAALHLRTEREAAVRMTTLAAIEALGSFGAHVKANIENADLRLRMLKFDYEQSPPAFHLLRYSEDNLIATQAGEQVVLTDADGRDVQATRLATLGDCIVSQAQFASLRDRRKVDLQVTVSQPGEAAESRSVCLTRRLSFPDGTFAGVIIMSESMKQLSKGGYHATTLGPGGMVAVVSDDGQALLRMINGVQANNSDNERDAPDYRALQGIRAGEFIDPVDGTPRIGAVTRLAGYPFTLVAAAAAGPSLMDYERPKRRILVYAAFASALVLLAGLALWVAVRQLQIWSASDPLTGLANRRLLMATLRKRAGALGATGRLAMLYLDLNDFKRINDSLGHRYGDALLGGVARQLVELAGQERLLARIGGDEFVILIERDQVATAARALALRVCEAFGRGIYPYAQPCMVHTSIGIAVYDAPLDSEFELMTRADLAMYAAKDAARRSAESAYHFFTPELLHTARREADLRRRLDKAIERGEFFVHYQPVVRLDGELLAVEALVRWRHPVLGESAPDEFIPLAEATGQIDLIGSFVLETACKDLRRWQEAGRSPPLLSVNVSPRQLMAPSYVNDVLLCLQAYGLTPAQLQLEVTETVILEGTAHVRKQLETLRAAGVRIVLDDFGTGYSSLSHLLALEIDGIKIAPTLTAGIPGRGAACAILTALIGMMRELGLTLIVEGIETGEQVSWLAEFGQIAAQGYYFSRPQSAVALQTMMAETER